MVSHEILAACEQPVIAVKSAVNALHDFAMADVRAGGVPANADHWGTVLLNLELLSACVDQAIKSVQQAKDAATGRGT